MKGAGGGGLLCRSHSAIAVCLPQDPQVMILSQQRRRRRRSDDDLLDFKYSRLGGAREPAGRRRSFGDRRPVTLSMLTKKEIPLPNAAAAASAEDDLVFQVVVMRVSLHCKGCEGKVRKHISKMEGVTSFSIDLESKRVTVMGHVSPMGVLESISKVKKAEFWPCS